MAIQWRLGIDLGTNSLGWWAFGVTKKNGRWDIAESLGGGVYIFPNGREPAKGGRVGDSNAVERRLARSIRRNRDRRKTRLRAFMKELVMLKLMPSSRKERDKLFQTPSGAQDPDLYNPYRLRAEAVERKLTPYELGRALFHLGLRRGFKSNRIEQGTDKDGGKLKESIGCLRSQLEGRTLGQFLWEQLCEEKKHQERGSLASGIRFRGYNELYPDRAMYEEEYEAIRTYQTSHHSLSSEDWDRLRDRYVLFQWPLKPVERGSCRFCPEEPRHWRDTPIGHDFRVYQEVNALRWFDLNHCEHSLDKEQRDNVLKLLMKQKSEVKFAALRKKKRKDGTLLFEGCTRFNLENVKRKGLKPHTVAATFSKDPVLAPLWEQRCSQVGDAGRLDDIYEALFIKNEQGGLESYLAEHFDLDDGVINILSKLKLSRDTANVSRKFMSDIVPVMRDQGLLYFEAVNELTNDDGNSLHHSYFPESKNLTQLPYYGEILRDSMIGADSGKDRDEEPEKHFGKINNPTVHVALNSLRRVVNSLINRFGSTPVEIHLELTRDLKKSREARDEINRNQAIGQRENDRIRSDLKKYDIAHPSGREIKKVKLWEELGKTKMARCCPFSGKTISFAQLFNGDAEIEHILPFKRTLDDSMSNLTVAMRWANKLKGNRTPYEAFATNAHAKDGIKWETVANAGKRLGDKKDWRFGPDAMRDFEEKNNFIARQLTDNAYIARAAASYLKCLKGVEQIVPNRGQLTALLRGKWKLNEILSDKNIKSREDHRHHAIDAAVVGLANRSVLKSISDQTARDANGQERIRVRDLPEQLKRNINEQASEIVVAFKPDHGWQGAMYKESAYGFVDDPDMPRHNLVIRKPLSGLTLKECDQIRDPIIRRQVESLGLKEMKEKSKVKAALDRFSEKHGIKSVRILVTDQTVKSIPSAPYKGYAPDSYVCCDIWRLPEGKTGAWKKGVYKWQGVYWPYAETPNGVPAPQKKCPHPAAKFITRLFKNDMIVYEDNNQTCIMRVAGFSTTNHKLDIVPHFAADPPQTYVSINVLGNKGLRKLRVAPDGQIKGLKP